MRVTAPGSPRFRALQRFKEMIESVRRIAEPEDLVTGGIFVGMKAELLVLDRRGSRSCVA